MKTLTQETQTPSLISEIMTVTPALAKEWLKTNERNRKVTSSNFKLLCRELRQGNWRLNGESIKFDHDNNLVDGQHRLMACVETGIPFQSLVVMGLDPASFQTIDTGRSRTASDVLSIQGEAQATTLSTGIRAAMLLEAGRTNFADKMPLIEMTEWLEKNPGIREYVQVGKVTRSLVGAYVFCGLRYLLMKKNPVQAALFFEQFEHGIGLSDKSPVKLLRDMLVVAKSKRAKLPLLDVLAFSIKAWNLFVTGKTATTLRLRKEEDFPTIK